ncbi:MAG TPA: hypothetical protein G4O12_06825 [Dehalococcoidia bacterium]|nr:hypothetical protein [Dehalococcoidia bacterium]
MWEAPVEFLGGLVSMAVGVIHDIPACKELVDRMIKDAEKQASNWQFVKVR